MMMMVHGHMKNGFKEKITIIKIMTQILAANAITKKNLIAMSPAFNTEEKSEQREYV